MKPRIATLDLVIRLRGEACRADAAQALAERLGVETLLLMVRDPALGALIPAPGFSQTLRGGRTWRAFLQRCSGPGRFSAEVELPTDTHRVVEAVVVEDVALFLLGGKPSDSELDVVISLLPLVAATLAAEQAAAIAKADAAAAKGTAGRAHALALALELSRAEAAALNAELRDAHRRKDEFLAMLAHELRNPLSPLVTSLELLRRHAVEPAVLKKLVEVMTRQTGQLTRLVDDLLEVSRIRHGRIELRRERVVLRDVIEDALDESRALVQAKQHRVEIEGTGEPLWVTADRVRLTQIFGNLLNNAAKYTDAGGRLKLTVRRENGCAVVDLQDTGVGISAEMLPRIFDLFTQAPVSLDRAQGGLGIGLTLVRTLVELHGGHITAVSPGIGKGSTFSVRLPLATHAGGSLDPASTARVTSERRERARLSY